MRTGGACVGALAEVAGVAGAGTIGVAGTAGVLGADGAVGATGALGAAAAEVVACEVCFSLADSHPAKERPVKVARKTLNDTCFKEVEIFISSIFIRFILPNLLSSSVQQQEGKYGLLYESPDYRSFCRSESAPIRKHSKIYRSISMTNWRQTLSLSATFNLQHFGTHRKTNPFFET